MRSLENYARVASDIGAVDRLFLFAILRLTLSGLQSPELKPHFLTCNYQVSFEVPPYREALYVRKRKTILRRR